MEVILDTNGLSAWLDGDEELKLKLIDAPKVWLSPIVLGEYRFGIKASRHREVYELKLADLEMDIPTLPIDAATSASYAEVRQALKNAGGRSHGTMSGSRPRQNSMVSELFPVMDILTLWKESLGLVGSCRHFFASRPLDCFSPPATRYPLLAACDISYRKSEVRELRLGGKAMLGGFTMGRHWICCVSRMGREWGLKSSTKMRRD